MKRDTSSLFRIDERVFFTMVLFCVVSILMFAYRYKNDKPCEVIRIIYPTSQLYQGTEIPFKAATDGGQTYEWDFGDNSIPVWSGSSTNHIYNNPGTYSVNLRINGKCSKHINLTIAERFIPKENNIQPNFTGPEYANINRSITFRDTTNGAKSWEWFFDESGNVNDTNRQATWIFRKAGPKTIYLRINGNASLVVRKNILINDPSARIGENKVKEKREGEPHPIVIIPPYPVNPPDTSRKTVLKLQDNNPNPVKTIAGPGASYEEVKSFLYDVVDNNKSAKDFKKFINNDLDFQVTYNGNTRSFYQMCFELERIKKRRVKEIDVQKLIVENGFIIELKVKLTKTTF